MNHSFGLLRNCILAGALALAATIAPALAATQAYLDFESTGSQSELPIKGEVQDNDLKGTLVKVSAFSFGAGKDGFIPKSTIGSATGGAGAGKITATPESMDVTVGMDATQKLFDLAATGKVIPHVRLLVFKAAKDGGKIPAFSALMSDVMIVSLNWAGKGDKPTANVTLDYRTIELVENTKGVNGTGAPSAPIGGWDRIQNKSVLTVPLTYWQNVPNANGRLAGSPNVSPADA
jgi:type VI protein secretion system component Hcp